MTMKGGRAFGLVLALAALPQLLGCWQQGMTYVEALEAVEEAALSSRGEALTEEIIEISTDFTMGEAVETAAQELHDALVSQIDCSTVTLDGSTVMVDFGTLDDECVYQGHTYAGVWAVTIERNDSADVLVNHEWTGLTNGDVTLDGTAEVTWSAAASSRRVKHDVVWNDIDGEVEATGDRTQTLIDPVLGLLAGIVVNGDRQWTSSTGDWSLEIDDVEMRGLDPVPQAGIYTLTTPDDVVVSLTFVRIDDNTIECTLAAPNKSWVFEVTSTGAISEA